MNQPTLESEQPEFLCPECDYQLLASNQERCPWCGWVIDPDVLLECVRTRRGGGRIGVSIAAIAVGIGSLVGFWSLFSGWGIASGRGAVHTHLSMWDGIAVVGVLGAAFGNLSLAGLAIASRSRWPMRRGDSAAVLRAIAGASFIAAVAGARPALHFPTEPLISHGVQVNGVMEFLAMAFFFATPAILLLLLCTIAFRSRRARSSRRHFGNTDVKSSMGRPAGFQVECSGRSSREQVKTIWSDARRITNPEIERRIAETWASRMQSARNSQENLYDGALARLIRTSNDDGKLLLELGPTSYRDFVGTNLRFDRAAPPESDNTRSDALGTSAIVATSDGFLALGRRTHRVAFHGGYAHTFGGMVELSDRGQNGIDVFLAIERELREELGIEPRDLLDLGLIGLVRDREILQPELIFDATTRVTRSQLQHLFASSLESRQEHSGLEFMPDEPDSVIPFIRRVEPITPVAEAALLLHGLHCWGRDWYEQASYILYEDIPGAMNLRGQRSSSS
ncbi:MAG: hypothetical protein HY287_14110 [Planctomycetes bacterium]|nr:hypothetical protein [Planctomycetota bacterium]